MNAQLNQKLESQLEEISAIVDSYDPKSEYIMGASIFAIIGICIFLILELGILWGLVLLGVAFLPILYKGIPDIKAQPSEKDLSRRVCSLMSSCVNIRKYPGDDPLSETHRMILVYSHDGNLPLYQEFISLFPHMASKKLKKLASIKLGLGN